MLWVTVLLTVCCSELTDAVGDCIVDSCSELTDAVGDCVVDSCSELTDAVGDCVVDSLLLRVDRCCG